MRTLYLISLVLLAVACRPETPESQEVLSQYDRYGSELTPEGAVPAAVVADDVATYAEEPVKVEGRARSVCTTKGCWVSLEAGPDRAIRVHVPRDYAGAYRFTLPDTIRGQRVIARGELQETALSEQELAHMRQDAGDSTFTPTPLRLLADAVLVHRP